MLPPRVMISDDCINCGACEPECPVGAISYYENMDMYYIDQQICDRCQFEDEPKCVEVCPVEAVVAYEVPHYAPSKKKFFDF